MTDEQPPKDPRAWSPARRKKFEATIERKRRKRKTVSKKPPKNAGMLIPLEAIKHLAEPRPKKALRKVNGHDKPPAFMFDASIATREQIAIAVLALLHKLL